MSALDRLAEEEMGPDGRVCGACDDLDDLAPCLACEAAIQRFQARAWTLAGFVPVDSPEGAQVLVDLERALTVH